MSKETFSVWGAFFAPSRLKMLALAPAIYGAILLATCWERSMDMRFPKFEELTVVAGKFIDTGQAVGISASLNGMPQRLLCRKLICGRFNRIRLDGKPAKVWVAPNKKIYQIEVDGVMRATFDSIRANDISEFRFGTALTFIGVGLFFFFRRRKTWHALKGSFFAS